MLAPKRSFRQPIFRSQSHPFAAWWILCGEKGIYRPAWMIHLEQKGRALAEEFRQCLHQRLGNVFQEIPGFDVQSFAAVMSQAAAFVQQSTATA